MNLRRSMVGDLKFDLFQAYRFLKIIYCKETGNKWCWLLVTGCWLLVTGYLYSNFLNPGALIQVNKVTSKVMHPPNITEGTVPNKVAATPLSNWPSSLDEFINMELTEET